MAKVRTSGKLHYPEWDDLEIIANEVINVLTKHNGDWLRHANTVRSTWGVNVFIQTFGKCSLSGTGRYMFRITPNGSTVLSTDTEWHDLTNLVDPNAIELIANQIVIHITNHIVKESNATTKS